MKYIKTKFKGLLVCEPEIFGDERGYFFEAFNEQEFETKTGIKAGFVQDNQSLSEYGVLRGLHLQKGKFAQAKLVRVLRGRVLDVVVDLRKVESTFGKHFSIELSSENRKQLFVPRGFAHGFVVLSEEAEFFYKCDNYYEPSSEAGILFDDPDLNIDWKIHKEEIKVSSKDLRNHSFKEFVTTEESKY